MQIRASEEQFFGSRVSRALNLDWMLPNDEFDRAVMDGLRRNFPELTEDARSVIAGNYSYSHAKSAFQQPHREHRPRDRRCPD